MCICQCVVYFLSSYPEISVVQVTVSRILEHKPWSSISNEQPISNERNVLDLLAVFASQCSLY